MARIVITVRTIHIFFIFLTSNRLFLEMTVRECALFPVGGIIIQDVA